MCVCGISEAFLPSITGLSRASAPLSVSRTPILQYSSGQLASQPVAQTNHHDFNILFLFSLLFNLSTRFRCIFTASCSYLSFSALAVRRSLIAWILRWGVLNSCQHLSNHGDNLRYKCFPGLNQDNKLIPGAQLPSHLSSLSPLLLWLR